MAVERLGQQFVIENKPGFGGNIATEYVVSSPPDGYTILMPVSTNAVNATLYPNLSFNFMRDIAPIAGIAKTPFVVVVPASFPGDPRDALGGLAGCSQHRRICVGLRCVRLVWRTPCWRPR
jgi:tripartite-type tricarboxylate transporter receptor subunit TctC